MTKTIKTVSVLTGESYSRDPVYPAQMYQLGRLLAQAQISVRVRGDSDMAESLIHGVISDKGEIISYHPYYERNSGDQFHTIKMTGSQANTALLSGTDAWITGLGRADFNSATMLGIFQNKEHAKRGRQITPHLVLNAAGVHDKLVQVYQRSLYSEPTRDLFTVACNVEDLMRKLTGAESRQAVVPDRPARLVI